MQSVGFERALHDHVAGQKITVLKHPIPFMQTRLMAQEKGEKPARYQGMLHALATIPKEEGIRALWKGLFPRLLRIPPGQAIVWAVSDQVTGYFEQQQKEKLVEEGLA